MAMPAGPRGRGARRRAPRWPRSWRWRSSFYRLQLTAPAAAEARAYLARRGLSDAAQRALGDRLAPGGPHRRSRRTEAKGVAARAAGRGRADRPRGTGAAPTTASADASSFRSATPRGRAIAFGGRALDADARAKYLNSPQTPLFDKGRTLFNHGPAREAAAKAGTLVVAEGYMDVIALAEAGFTRAVAPLGTAITDDQLALLWRSPTSRSSRSTATPRACGPRCG